MGEKAEVCQITQRLDWMDCNVKFWVKLLSICMAEITREVQQGVSAVICKTYGALLLNNKMINFKYTAPSNKNNKMYNTEKNVGKKRRRKQYNRNKNTILVMKLV